jgi:hypothetical protein
MAVVISSAICQQASAACRIRQSAFAFVYVPLWLATWQVDEIEASDTF